MTGLREVAGDQPLEVLRLLAGRCRQIGENRARMVCQPHQLLLELLPGGAQNTGEGTARMPAIEIQPIA